MLLSSFVYNVFMDTILTTTQKALRINLDPERYGTIAEIGAGQEVAGHFFRAGAASGTIAKTISAYDMTISDTLYGSAPGGRYVCQERLNQMLDYEFNLIKERLEGKRKHLFAYASTISARNFHGTNDAHGWMGIRFYGENKKVNTVIMHFRLFDNTHQLQQEACGILGINLINLCFFPHEDVRSSLLSLMDELSRERVEIDMLRFEAADLKMFDNRLVGLELVHSGMTDAVMFKSNGEIALCQDELYKKNVLFARGSYRPPTLVNMDLIQSGVNAFKKKNAIKTVMPIAELTIHNLKSSGELELEDFLARVDLLAGMGLPVVLSNFAEYFKLIDFIARFKCPHMALVLGAYNFQQIFEAQTYKILDGGLMEALGHLFRENVDIFLYPYKEQESDNSIIDLNNLPIKSKYRPLLKYLQNSGNISSIEDYDESITHIYSRKVLNMIVQDEDGWREMVPPEIAKIIDEKCLFGHPCFRKI